MFEVIVPKVEANTNEIKLVEWLKKENEPITKGEPLFAIETAKAVVEIEAEESGILRKILVEQGESVPILTVVAFIGNKEEPIPEIKQTNQLEDVSSTPEIDIQIEPKILKEEDEKTENTQRVKASPVAKRLAREHNIDLSLIKGTGPENRITREDIEKEISKNKKL